MKCFRCRRDITGNDYATRIEVRAGLVFGKGMRDGFLSQATGPLDKVFHRKCWFAWARQQKLQAAKGDAPERRVTDWRDQEVHDLEDFVEGDRSD